MADEDVNETSVEAEAPVEEVAEEVTEDAVAEPVAEAEATDAGVVASAEAETEAEDAAAAEAPAKRKKKRLPRSERRQRTKPKREQPAERRPITRLPKSEHERGRTQERQGTVVSAAADKTIVVRVDTVKVHPRYKKVIRRSRKFHAHDEQNEAKVGDVVLIVETRPLSRMKRWRLQKVVEAAR
jgi:small subunit ribosomal protein S17